MNFSICRSTKAHALGRTYLLDCDGPLGGPEPGALLSTVTKCGARVVLIDAMSSPFADSDGLRWLLRLRSAAEERGISLRIATPEGGKVWRNIALLQAGLLLYPSAQCAWCAPGPNETIQTRQTAAKAAKAPKTVASTAARRSSSLLALMPCSIAGKMSAVNLAEVTEPCFAWDLYPWLAEAISRSAVCF